MVAYCLNLEDSRFKSAKVEQYPNKQHSQIVFYTLQDSSCSIIEVIISIIQDYYSTFEVLKAFGVFLS